MENEISNKLHYDGLDILKALCAFLIICMHAPFEGVCGEYVTLIARIGVPVFFMVTGYFYNRTIDSGREIYQIHKILHIFIGANLLYFIYNFLRSILHGTTLEYLQTTFTLKNIMQFVMFNQSMFGWHLWYLGAILYVLIIFAVLRKYIPKYKNIVYGLTPLLLMGDLMMGKYSILLFGKDSINYIMIRNFLFVGIPYFTIGLFLNEKKDIFQKIGSKKVMCYLLAILFIGTTFLEHFVLIYLNANSAREHYISTTFLAIILFIIFANDSWNNGKYRHLRVIGKEYSAMIYIIHPIFIDILSAVFNKFHLLFLYSYMQPIIIYIAVIIFAFMYYKARDLLKAHH